MITAMVMSGYRGFYDLGTGVNAEGPGPDIRCFDENNCILKVGDKWYVVTDVLDAKDVPLKFRINLDEVVVEDTLIQIIP